MREGGLTAPGCKIQSSINFQRWNYCFDRLTPGEGKSWLDEGSPAKRQLVPFRQLPLWFLFFVTKRQPYKLTLFSSETSHWTCSRSNFNLKWGYKDPESMTPNQNVRLPISFQWTVLYNYKCSSFTRSRISNALIWILHTGHWPIPLYNLCLISV